MNEYWPPLVVRRWQEILYSRDPDDWFDRDHDPIAEAVISRPLHELRGLVVGQVAEIESLLLHVAQEIRDRYMRTLPGRQKRKGAGGALQDVRKLLTALALEDGLSAELEKIGRVIDRRNRLVHGIIHIGFGRLGPQAVSIHGGAVNWCQFTVGSGGSQGFPSMAVRMASSAVMPWAAAESR